MGRLAEHRSALRSARLLTAVYALATVVSLSLTLFDSKGTSSSWAAIFGLLNVPVGPTFVSVVVLALVTRALLGRKRIGLWLVALFQLVAIYLGVTELAPATRLPLAELWEARGDVGRGLDVVAMLVALVVLGWLTRLRHEFTGRVTPGSWWLSLGALVAGSVVTLGVAWVLLGVVHASRSQVSLVVGTVLAVFGGVSRRSLVGVPVWVIDVVAVCAAATILVAVVLFLASSRSSSRWSPDREVVLRRLLAEHGADDSLGYFATRRDRASVMSPDGRAAVTYRVHAGVSLAAGDPVGDPDSWRAAIIAWRAEARRYGWLPAVLSASESGARAYAATGLRVLLLGDEALLDPRQFDVRRASLSGVRRAAKRASRAGLVVQVRRQQQLSSADLTEISEQAHAWRAGHPERGFSTALGRTADTADTADADVLYGTATDSDGHLAGVLSFVPWGRSGLSLDVMRRSPSAPNGVTELMVTTLMARAADLGVVRMSLNFCMFRRVFEDAELMGSRSLTRLNASVLGLFDRFWQLERLYRSNAGYEPTWSPRFLWYDDAVSLPQVALAAGIAEGFLPSPRSTIGRGGALDANHLAHIVTLGSRRQRAAVLTSIRETLADAGFLEMETPMLHSTHGGATARPFRTFSNSYGVDLSLRIAPELYLKRLLVGGLGPIYEMGRSFRNEGADATHNPEFTSLEVYRPHADYTTMRQLTERIITQSAICIHGRKALPIPAIGRGRTGSEGVDLVDISAPWPVVPVLDAVSRAIGRTVTLDTDMDVLMGIAGEHGVVVHSAMGPGAVIEGLYEELVEPVTMTPTFYTDFPVETSPLAHRHRSAPGLAERWDLVIGGMEIGTAYSELTDPVDQRARLTAQSLKAAAGDPEAMEIDEDFLMALETGMPPSGGLGIGIDRLVMVLTNTSIRHVLTFPFVRPAPSDLRARVVSTPWH
ncbi:phosphatidylglycerol lysyltransferase domain-containing protein [Dermatophilaceae bacterium Soc4.6]